MIRRTQFTDGSSAAYALPTLRTVPTTANAVIPSYRIHNYAYGLSPLNMRPVVPNGQ